MSDAPHQPSSAITPESIRNFLPGSFPGDLGIDPLEVEDSHARGRIVVGFETVELLERGHHVRDVQNPVALEP